MYSSLLTRSLWLCLASLIGPLAWADTDECNPSTPGCVEIGKWRVNLALGAGVRTNPILNREDIPLIVLPEISYTGSRFFIQNLDFGAVLWESERQQVNLFITPSYEQVFFHRWSPSNFIFESPMVTFSDSSESLPIWANSAKEIPPPTLLGEEDSPPPSLLATRTVKADERLDLPKDEVTTPAIQLSEWQLNVDQPVLAQPKQESERLPSYEYKTVDLANLHKRRMAALAGFEYSYTGEQWNFQAQWLQDISGIHNGTEVRLALAKPFYWDKQALVFSLGATWQSAAVVDYYYGIRPDEISVAGGAYQGRAGVSYVARVDWDYALSERWSLRFNLSYRHLAEEITRSPLLSNNQVITAFAGGVYHF